MHKDEPFILANISALLSAHEVKAETQKISGEWILNDDEITCIWPTPNNVEFTILLVNGNACLRVSAKINRKTAMLSDIQVEAI